MPSPVSPTAADINTWAIHGDSRAQFPRLIRGLLRETCITGHLEMSGGEAVNRPGFDGTADIVSSAWSPCPLGETVWELGAGEDPGKKAGGDYLKRTKKGLVGVDRAKTTFVFATPRLWNAKPWTATKEKDKIWKAVKVVDAELIEQWLELAPKTELWLAEKIYGALPGIKTLARSWTEWTGATSPVLTGSFVLAGRREEAGRVREAAGQPGRAITVRADSRAEARAFVAAALWGDDEAAPDDDIGRAVVVSDATGWAKIITWKGPLLLIPDPVGLPVAAATAAGHTVITVLGRDDPSQADVEVPRLDVDEAAKALEAAGAGAQRSRDWAVSARLNLLAFRRDHPAPGQTFSPPPWATAEAARALVPALMAGEWIAGNEDDRRELSALAGGIDYADLEAALTVLSRSFDPPVRFADGKWYVTSKHDLWGNLAKFTLTGHLSRFQVAATRVIATPDPVWDWPWDTGAGWAKAFEQARERELAARVAPRYSTSLRQGLADSVAMLAASSEAPAAGPREVQTAVGNVVRGVTQALARDATCGVWVAIGQALPLLAEVDPRRVLATIEAAARPRGSIASLFGDERRARLFAASQGMYGTVAALEVLAWRAEFVPRVTSALGMLGSLVGIEAKQNPPLTALVQMFTLWLPQTGGTLADRLRAIDVELRQRNSAVAWKLLLKLLPQDFGMSGYTRRPRWRADWRPDERRLGVTIAELAEAATLVASRAVEDAGVDGERWAELVEAFPRLPKVSRQLIHERLAALDVTALGEDGREAIRRQVREVVGRHRAYADAKWAMPRSEVDWLDELGPRFEPETLARRHRWLFDDYVHPHLLASRRGRESEEQVVRAREHALRQIADEEGIGGLATLAEAAQRPWHVGWAFASVPDRVRLHEAMLRWAATGNRALEDAAEGLFVAWSEAKGIAWAEATIRKESWGPDTAGRLMRNVREGTAAWDCVARLGADCERAYWRLFRGYPAEADVPRAVDRLLAVGRPRAAADLVAMRIETAAAGGLSTEAVMAAMRASVGEPSPWDMPRAIDGYEVRKIFSWLEERGAPGLAELEWDCLPMLSSADVELTSLDRRLADDPRFFVEVLSLAFRAHTHDEGEPPADEPAAAAAPGDDADRDLHAYHVLARWKTVPGSVPGGSIDRDRLFAWVEEARRRAADADRLEAADTCLGRVLRFAPVGSDGLWPDEAVRDLADEVDTDGMRGGLAMGFTNSGGATFRSLKDGGRRERELAANYRRMADALGHWRTVPDVLEDLAQEADREAEREDGESERLIDTD